MQHKGGINDLAFTLCEIHVNRASQIALVAQECSQVVAALLSLQRVINHRGLTHRLQSAVEPFGGVSSC